MRAILLPIMHRLRQWDISTSARVDRFIANSNVVANRIEKYYRREVDVIHPPVSLGKQEESDKKSSIVVRDDFYLFVGELVDYKRVDLAIEACEKLGKKLCVVGDGRRSTKLQNLAKSKNVEFLGRVSDAQLYQLMMSAKCLLFPGEEDFGMVPVEALLCGLPVIAFASGGALDIIGRDTKLGVLFDKANSSSLADAINLFEAKFSLDRNYLRRSAKKFEPKIFRKKFVQVVSDEFSKRAKYD